MDRPFSISLLIFPATPSFSLNSSNLSAILVIFLLLSFFGFSIWSNYEDGRRRLRDWERERERVYFTWGGQFYHVAMAACWRGSSWGKKTRYFNAFLVLLSRLFDEMRFRTEDQIRRVAEKMKGRSVGSACTRREHTNSLVAYFGVVCIFC